MYVSRTDIQDLWTQLTRFTDVAGLKQHLIEMVQENVTTVRAVAESLWGLICELITVILSQILILAANLSVIGSLLVGTLGLVLNFGMELVNFIIQLTGTFHNFCGSDKNHFQYSSPSCTTCSLRAQRSGSRSSGWHCSIRLVDMPLMMIMAMVSEGTVDAIWVL